MSQTILLIIALLCVYAIGFIFGYIGSCKNTCSEARNCDLEKDEVENDVEPIEVFKTHVPGQTEKPCKNHVLVFGRKMNSNIAEQKGILDHSGGSIDRCKRCKWVIWRRDL